MKPTKTHEVKIFIGSVNEVTKNPFTEKDLTKAIQEFQEKNNCKITVRITKTNFVSGLSYFEKGWEIGAINYPRFFVNISQINKFMISLGSELLSRFKQKRVSVVTPSKTIVLENSYESN